MPDAADRSAPSESVAAVRKIIYTARLELVVADFSVADKRLTALIGESQGYIARFEEERRAGNQLAGYWIVRIPVDQFDSFLDQVASLGVPRAREIEAKDVTEEYIDMEARRNNKQKLERRLLQLLEERTGEIKDIIEVETQLGRVREEIEALEGKLRFLADRVAMTTVSIRAREDRSYTPAEAPGFVTEIRQTFTRSLNGLATAGRSGVLAAVLLLPWLAAATLIVSPVGLLIWRRFGSRRRS